MGLFSRRAAERLVHRAVPRTVHVRADRDAVVAHLEAYSGLFSPRHAEWRSVLVGSVDGWCAIRLPHVLHPWQLHNLTNWMLDCPGAGRDVIAESAAGYDHHAYWLVADPDLPDALCGRDEFGEGWTVHVPGNDVVHPAEVPVTAPVIPVGHGDWEEIEVLLEDPGHAMNPTNVPTVKSRRALEQRSDGLLV